MSETQDALNIPIILGASRPERQSAQVAQYIYKIFQTYPNIQTQLVDVKDFKLEYDDDKSIPEFHKIVVAADAFILVFPEYNHGFPGKLKSLLDTEFDEYKHKPVALASISSGQFGGVRAVELLIPVLVDIGLLPSGINLHFPHIKETFDEQGNPKGKEEARVNKFLKQLIYLTRVIKVGKEMVKE